MNSRRATGQHKIYLYTCNLCHVMKSCHITCIKNEIKISYEINNYLIDKYFLMRV